MNFCKTSFSVFLFSVRSIPDQPSRFHLVHPKINLPINNSLSSRTIIVLRTRARGPVSGAYAVRHLDRISSLIYAIRHDDWTFRPLTSCTVCSSSRSVRRIRSRAAALRDPFSRLPHVQKHFDSRLVLTVFNEDHGWDSGKKKKKNSQRPYIFIFHEAL